MFFDFFRDGETRIKLGCIVFLLVMVIVVSVLITSHVPDTEFVCTWCTT